MSKYRLAQKFMVSCHGMSFRTTVFDILAGVGDSPRFNRALNEALASLDEFEDSAIGVNGHFSGFSLSLNLIKD